MQEMPVQYPNAAVQTWPRALPVQTGLQESIHERHWDRRAFIILALADSYMPWSTKQAARQAMCCNGASFFIDPATGKTKPWISRCHTRTCPYCGRFRQGQVAEQLQTILRQMEDPRVIVLTVKSVDRPLSDQLCSLRHDFAKLRRTKMWKKLVQGGAYTLQVTYNPKTTLWHPHLHILYDGAYFPQKLLRRLWHDATGSAEIVWVEKIRDFQGAARELARYIGSPPDIDKIPAAAFRTYAEAVNGARMIQTFGNCHGLKLTDKDDVDVEGPDTYSIKISTLVHLTFRGAETPAKLLVLIAERWPQFRPYIYHALPRLERPTTKTDRIKRLLRKVNGRAPPIPPKLAAGAVRQLQDREIFMAFTRYRADEAADVFTDLQYQHVD